MPRPVPTPVNAAIGLLPAVLNGVRKLPQRAASLPVNALVKLDGAKREYDELAERGERIVSRLRGGDRSVQNAAEAKVETKTATRDAAAALRAMPAAMPAAGPAPAAPDSRTSNGKVDTAATADVVEAVERAAAKVDAPTITEHADLPLPDYDHMTLGSLRGRLRSLTLEQLVQLREYEKARADRLPVITMLDNRIAKLASGESSVSGNASTEPAPEQRGATHGGSKVTPATARPKVNPPTNGVPSNPSLGR